MKSLIRKELVLSFYFDIEKFCLTAVGEEIAKKLWEDKTNYDSDNEELAEGKLEDEENDEKAEVPIGIEHKITILTKEIESHKIWLYIDNREVKAANERSFFHTKLAENGIPCLLHNLPIGDFLWVLEIKGKILL